MNITRKINQAQLTSECWDVQFWGLSQCGSCKVKDTPDCGGKEIRKTGKNKDGFAVPVD